MQIFIKAPHGKTYLIQSLSNDTSVSELKSAVLESTGIPQSEQRLVFQSKELKLESTLQENKI